MTSPGRTRSSGGAGEGGGGSAPSGEVRLLPNLREEEGLPWGAWRGVPVLRAVVRLWLLLFGPEARLFDESRPAMRDLWPVALGPVPTAPVWSWLPGGNAGGSGQAAGEENGDAAVNLVPWLSTARTVRRAARSGWVHAAPPPGATARVHDKAFALRVARGEGLEPAGLRGLCRILDPVELRDTAAALRSIEETVRGWPGWTGGRFVLKPRRGTGGRGRVPGGPSEPDRARIRASLPRLAARGGAILEPWLDRALDLSAQVWIAPDGAVEILGTTEQILSPAGLAMGNRGIVDGGKRVASGTAFDGALRSAAAAAACAARAQGFHGTMGIDAFAFRLPGEDSLHLRPLVECNARTTTGLIALGLVRRALDRRSSPESGRIPEPTARLAPRRFRFDLDDARAARATREAPAEGLVSIPLGAPGESVHPGLRLLLG